MPAADAEYGPEPMSDLASPPPDHATLHETAHIIVALYQEMNARWGYRRRLRKPESGP